MKNILVGSLLIGLIGCESAETVSENHLKSMYVPLGYVALSLEQKENKVKQVDYLSFNEKDLGQKGGEIIIKYAVDVKGKQEPQQKIFVAKLSEVLGSNIQGQSMTFALDAENDKGKITPIDGLRLERGQSFSHYWRIDRISIDGKNVELPVE